MSSILFSNPYVGQSAPPPIPLPEPMTGIAVAASGNAASGGATGGPNAGSQERGSRQRANAALMRTARSTASPRRPPDATLTSAVGAQVQTSEKPDRVSEARARQSALSLMRSVTLLQQPEGIFPFEKKMPEFSMPDPLPTSPYLKPA